jgi:hypothetical protein
LAAVQPVGGTGDYRWGYVDRQGRLVIPPQFCEAGPFLPGGLALVTLDQAGTEHAYIDSAGEVVYVWVTPTE